MFPFRFSDIKHVSLPRHLLFLMPIARHDTTTFAYCLLLYIYFHFVSFSFHHFQQFVFAIKINIKNIYNRNNHNHKYFSYFYIFFIFSLSPTLTHGCIFYYTYILIHSYSVYIFINIFACNKDIKL